MQVMQIFCHIAIILLLTVEIFSGVPSSENGVSSSELTFNFCNQPYSVSGYQNDQVTKEIYIFRGRMIYIPQTFPGGAVVNNPSANAEDSGDVNSIPGSGKSLEQEMATHSSNTCLENSMDTGAWQGSYGPCGHKRVRHN